MATEHTSSVYQEAQRLSGISELDASERGPAYGAMTLDGKPVTSIRFERSEKDGVQAYDVSFHVGNKTIDKLKGIDAATLAAAAGEKNAKAMLEHTEVKGSLRGETLMNESGLTPEEINRRATEWQAQRESELRLREQMALQQERSEPDLPDELNVVTPFRQSELEVMDGQEVIARADRLRQQERERLGREQDALGSKAEGKRIDVENLSEKALEQNEANDIAERTGGNSDRDSQQLTEREKLRQVELMDQVHKQFHVAGSKYYFKDQPNQLAMKDKGDRMVSASNDDRVAKAMATMAEAKGWKTITVSGHKDFRREMWMEANLRGIDVRGYKPTEHEIAMLDARRESAMRNSVERGPERQRPEAERKTDSAQREQPAAPELKSDKAKTAQAVADAFIDSKVSNPAQREALKAAVNQRMVQREQAGKVPAVPVYDKAAPSKAQQPERTGPVVERNAERVR